LPSSPHWAPTSIVFDIESELATIAGRRAIAIKSPEASSGQTQSVFAREN
jgi:hypothetical protein